MSWFSKWFRKVIQRANTIWQDSVAPAVKAAWERFSNELEAIAFDAVSKLALTQLSGSQKFEEAAKAVIAEAKARGWVVATSAVHLLVQRAYVNYKASKGELDVFKEAPKQP
jgi:hypothetical protein